MPLDRITAALEARRRILLCGAAGTGKSTLAAALGARLGAPRAACLCIGCDLGSPAFGFPGAVCLGEWRDGRWSLVDYEPLCSLDVARFRLPLVRAVRRVLERAARPALLELPALEQPSARLTPEQPGARPAAEPPEIRPALLLDGPGLVRAVAAAELLEGLVAAASVDLVVLLERAGAPLDIENELATLGVEVLRMPADPRAHPPSARARTRRRTELWNAFLADAAVRVIDLERLPAVGTPPPLDAPVAWAGRQAALLRDGECVAVGEIERVDGRLARVLACGRAAEGATAVLVRDAVRGADGLLNTAKPVGREGAGAGVRAGAGGQAGAGVGRAEGAACVPGGTSSAQDACETWSSEVEHGTEPSAPARFRPAARVGPFAATLLNGVFGDPLLLVRLRHARRSLLFDIGDAGRLPARIAHQVTDVFISHAHADHIAGFLSFLRSRIGDFPACRVFGPQGIAGNIAGLVAGIHWDRVGDAAPRFEIGELRDGERLVRFAASPGWSGPSRLGEEDAAGGVLLSDPLLRVRAALLDHRTPVLAYSLESTLEAKVRKERLAALGIAPGPWLSELKRRFVARDYDATVELPQGAARSVGALGAELLMIEPGRKLVYATDLADTADNRRRLASLARGAHTMFCEATFRDVHAAQAERTGHLTARACGEIATAAGVERLVPFHFSRRYESDPTAVYREVRAACPRVVLPPGVAA